MATSYPILSYPMYPSRVLRALLPYPSLLLPFIINFNFVPFFTLFSCFFLLPEFHFYGSPVTSIFSYVFSLVLCFITAVSLFPSFIFLIFTVIFLFFIIPFCLFPKIFSYFSSFCFLSFPLFPLPVILLSSCHPFLFFLSSCFFLPRHGPRLRNLLKCSPVAHFMLS